MSLNIIHIIITIQIHIGFRKTESPRGAGSDPEDSIIQRLLNVHALLSYNAQINRTYINTLYMIYISATS